ncbi:MAG: DUF7282 domain-containing protein [Bacteroidota bacterium]
MEESYRGSLGFMTFNKFFNYFLVYSFLLLITSCDEEEVPKIPNRTLVVQDQIIENNKFKIDSLTIDKPGWLVIYRDKEDTSEPDLTGPTTEPHYLEAGTTKHITVSSGDLGEIKEDERFWAVLHSDNGQLEIFEYKNNSFTDMPFEDANGDILAVSFTVTIKARGSLYVTNQLISQDSVRIKNVFINKDGWIVARKVINDGLPQNSLISHPLFLTEGHHDNLFIRLKGNAQLNDSDQIQLVLHEDSGIDGEFEYDENNEVDQPVEAYSEGIIEETISLYTPFMKAESQLIDENTFIIDEVLAASAGWLAVFSDTTETAPGNLIGYLEIDSGHHENLSIDLQGSILTDGQTIIPALYVKNNEAVDFEPTDENKEFFDGNPIKIKVETIPPSGFVEVNDVPVSDNLIMTDNVNVDINGWFTLCRSKESGNGPDTSNIISNVGHLFPNDNPHAGLYLNEEVAVGETVYILVHIDNGEIGEFEFEDDLGYDEIVAYEAVTILPTTGSIVASDQIVQGNTIIVDDIEMNSSSWVVVHPDDGSGNPLSSEFLAEPEKLIAGGLFSDFEIMLNQSVNPGATLHLTLYNDTGVIHEFEYDGVNGLDEPITNTSFTVLPPQGSITVENQEVSGTTLIVESISADQSSLAVVYRDDGSNNSADMTDIISEPYPLEAGTTNDLIITLSDTVSDGDRLWIGLHNDNGEIGNFEFHESDTHDQLITSSSFDIEKYPPTHYHVTSGGFYTLIFNGGGFTDSPNPTLVLTRGSTYTFLIDANGKAFHITRFQTSGSYSAYDKRITNNGTRSGLITFTVPMDAPDKLHYNGGHDTHGIINIID